MESDCTELFIDTTEPKLRGSSAGTASPSRDKPLMDVIASRQIELRGGKAGSERKESGTDVDTSGLAMP